MFLKKHTEFQKNIGEKSVEVIADRLLDLDNIRKKK